MCTPGSHTITSGEAKRCSRAKRISLPNCWNKAWYLLLVIIDSNRSYGFVTSKLPASHVKHHQRIEIVYFWSGVLELQIFPEHSNHSTDIKLLTDKEKTHTHSLSLLTPTKTRSKQYNMDSYWKEKDRDRKGHLDL